MTMSIVCSYGILQVLLSSFIIGNDDGKLNIDVASKMVCKDVKVVNIWLTEVYGEGSKLGGQSHKDCLAGLILGVDYEDCWLYIH